NDFSVPWFWLKKGRRGHFLCEVCSLGMLQLAASGGMVEGDPDPPPLPGQEEFRYRALLINGSTSLPFGELELKSIARELTCEIKRPGSPPLSFDVECADSADEVVRIRRRYRTDR